MLDTLISRVTIDPKICNGKPIVRGKRITVQTILEFLSAGDTEDEILYQYPSLEKEDIAARLEFVVALTSRNYTIRALIPMQNAA